MVFTTSRSDLLNRNLPVTSVSKILSLLLCTSESLTDVTESFLLVWADFFHILNLHFTVHNHKKQVQYEKCKQRNNTAKLYITGVYWFCQNVVCSMHYVIYINHNTFDTSLKISSIQLTSLPFILYPIMHWVTAAEACHVTILA